MLVSEVRHQLLWAAGTVHVHGRVCNKLIGYRSEYRGPARGAVSVSYPVPSLGPELEGGHGLGMSLCLHHLSYAYVTLRAT